VSPAIALALSLQGTEAARPTTWDPVVYFEHGSAVLPPTAKETVREVVAYAGKRGYSRVIVIAHSDTSGPPGVNLQLSKRRAEAIAAAFADDGFGADQVAIVAAGEEWPAVDTGDGVKEPLNRRATISFER
jgi:outer membrane protein OmpA-like peptidoglycan-associated protein